MAGKANEQASTIGHAGAAGASHIDSAESGLTAPAAATEKAIATAYEQPRDAKQQEIDQKKAAGEERWNQHHTGKKKKH